MSRDIILVLIGAAIALVTSIVTAFVQHFLSLRAEKKKRAWEKEERESQEFKKRLAEATQIQLEAVRDTMRKGTMSCIEKSTSVEDIIKQILREEDEEHKPTNQTPA